MQVLNNTGSIMPIKTPMGVGLGNFDGLHIGHMTLINTLISECRFQGLASIVYTFTKHPENILRKKLFTPLITTVGKKIELLGSTSLDYLYFDEFDESFSRMKPESFVKEILVERFNIKLAVAGFDYRYGYRGQGDVKLLEEIGKRYGFKVIVIPPVKIRDQVVSSTSIRSLIHKGDMDSVFNFLGRHYSITGEVTNGRRIGSKIGFPTANLHPEDYLVLPHDGVYVTKTLLNGTLLPSITNIGRNPTFGDRENVSVETHILDFEGDIYNTSIEVFFISKVRGERKFSGKDELIRQIKLDIEYTRGFFGLNVKIPG
jgi:riboflavin kinase/FMN adenylyltransferase